MNKRIVSPEKLNEMVRVSKPRIWIILALLVILIGGGLAAFLSNSIISREVHDCYVAENTTTVEFFLEQKIKMGVGDDPEFMESIKRNNNSAFLNSSVQPAYILINSLDNTEIVPGMKTHIQDKEGFVFDISAEKLGYDNICTLTGMSEEELTEKNIVPGTAFYLATVLIPCDSKAPVLKDGYSSATVTLSEVDPISLILK